MLSQFAESPPDFPFPEYRSNEPNHPESSSRLNTDSPDERLFARLSANPIDAARLVMTANPGFAEAAAALGDVHAPDGLLDALDQELASITLFNDTLDALQRLRGVGYRLGVISNLASPYGVPLRRLLI